MLFSIYYWIATNSIFILDKVFWLKFEKLLDILLKINN
jgi:hypothetical protein